MAEKEEKWDDLICPRCGNKLSVEFHPGGRDCYGGEFPPYRVIGCLNCQIPVVMAGMETKDELMKFIRHLSSQDTMADGKVKGEAIKESKQGDLVCPWCRKGKLSVHFWPGEHDGQTGVMGASFNRIRCSGCSLEISIGGSEESKEFALGPIRELIDLRKKMAGLRRLLRHGHV